MMDDPATVGLGWPDPAGAQAVGSDEPPNQIIETHLSRLFLTPDRVYKQLKPVTTTFVDLAGTEDRLAAAAREHELNARFSPDVYLGTADVEEHDRLTDRFVVMRRLPADRQLDRLVDSPELDDRIRDVARLVATIHAAQPSERGHRARGATGDALRANWEDTFAALGPLVGAVIPEAEHALAVRLVDRYLQGRGPLLDQRIESGWIRDGHGDLRAEHVFCLDDGPRLIDCLAFRDDLRIGDVLADIGFLAMDLHRLAGPVAAMGLIRHYDSFTGERHPSSLAHHYVAYRAGVRAKVAAVRLGQRSRAATGPAAQEVFEYHALALQHLLIGQPRLILIGGGPGVGKSTVASGVADALGAVWLRTDEIRKNLVGLSSADRAEAEPDQGIYRPELSDRIYREMLWRAETLLGRGESVVLDATWSADHRRVWARELAERAAVSSTEIECKVPLPVARERIARRQAEGDRPAGEPSDATPAVADLVAGRFDRWDEAGDVDTGQPAARSVEAACYLVVGADAAPRAEGPPADREAHLGEVRLSSETVELFLSRISVWERGVDTFPRPPSGRHL